MNALPELLAMAIPLVFAVSAGRATEATAFRGPVRASYLALLLAVGTLASPARSPRFEHVVRLDRVSQVMLILVCFVAMIIVRYARTYLEGAGGQARFTRALLLTLAAVTVLVLAGNLVVIAIAWMATSLALHQLLTFYRDRPRALVAAHKKFLVSRLADGCMLGAIAMIGSSTGHLDLDGVEAAVSDRPLSDGMQGAALLLVIAVSLKSAQLPFHGWLLQVMEAPTPVSALLHAGVVNIGGFVMIRLAPLMAHAPLAQTLLVMIGTTTAVVAGLVAMTRVSIKVALAWSTCAQMGFMLVECGLGAWHLALLHLVAHSLYKAHAFLSASSAVDAWRMQAMTRPRAAVSLLRIFGVSGIALASAASALFVLGGGAASATLLPLVFVLLSVTPFVARAVGGERRALVGVVLRATLLVALSSGAHAVSARFVPFPETETPAFAWSYFVGGFLVLFVVQTILEHRPDSRFSRWLKPKLYAGFFLDERFTRMTFRVWPPRLPLESR